MNRIQEVTSLITASATLNKGVKPKGLE
ncbi:MAG: hypothetical protein ACI8PD_001005, partial [Nitrospinales bacterium]